MTEEVRTDDAADSEQANWTVKAVPTRTRILARACATRAHKSTAAWLEWAVEVAAAQQGQGAVLPPVANRSANLTIEHVATHDRRHLASQFQELTELATLAVELTPPGKDSLAMKTVRSVVRAHASALLLEARVAIEKPELAARRRRGQQVGTDKANKQLPAPDAEA